MPGSLVSSTESEVPPTWFLFCIVSLQASFGFNSHLLAASLSQPDLSSPPSSVSLEFRGIFKTLHQPISETHPRTSSPNRHSRFPTTMPSKAGHVAAKALGIKLQDKDPFRELDKPGASFVSERTAHTFVEEPPLVLEYINGLVPSGHELYEYLVSLFPFLSWIGHYNLQWLIGDLVAGKLTRLVRVKKKKRSCSPFNRHHHRRGRRPTGHGLCQTG